jgi:hypothetical protein
MPYSGKGLGADQSHCWMPYSGNVLGTDQSHCWMPYSGSVLGSEPMAFLPLALKVVQDLLRWVVQETIDRVVVTLN